MESALAFLCNRLLPAFGLVLAGHCEGGGHRLVCRTLFVVPAIRILDAIKSAAHFLDHVRPLAEFPRGIYVVLHRSRALDAGWCGRGVLHVRGCGANEPTIMTLRVIGLLIVVVPWGNNFVSCLRPRLHLFIRQPPRGLLLPRLAVNHGLPPVLFPSRRREGLRVETVSSHQIGGRKNIHLHSCKSPIRADYRKNTHAFLLASTSPPAEYPPSFPSLSHRVSAPCPVPSERGDVSLSSCCESARARHRISFQEPSSPNRDIGQR